MEKEFGKLTYDQFQGITKRLPDIRADMRELVQLAQTKREKVISLLGPDHHSWGHIYEFSFKEQIAILMVGTGLNVPLQDAAISSDPQQAVLEWLEPGGTLDVWCDENQYFSRLDSV